MEENNQIGGQIKHGFIWNFAEQVSYKLIQFIIQLVLARILVPDDYGLCALVLAFINIADVLVKSGFGSALIQKKDVRSIDFSSVCYFSIGIAVFLYIIIFFSSPYIAEFFNEERITSVMRIMGFSLIIGAFNSVQIAIVYRKLQFKKSFAGNILGLSISSLAGIMAAIYGCGVWALVIQYITDKIVNCFAFYRLVRWLPKREFSFVRIEQLFSYGWKLMVSSLFQTVSSDVYSLVIGKIFTKSQLGVYDTGKKIPANLGNTIANTMGGVLFPAFSKIQNNPEMMCVYLKKTNRFSCFIIFPFMMGIAAMARPLVDIILTAKWSAAVPILQIACFIYMFYPIHLANLQIAKAVGRTDITMWQEIWKKVVDIVMLIITAHFGLVWVAVGLLISNTIALWINIEPINRFIHYNTLNQLRDVMPSFIVGLMTASVMFLIDEILKVNNWLILMIQLLGGSTLFICLTLLYNKRLFMQVREEILYLKK